MAHIVSIQYISDVEVSDEDYEYESDHEYISDEESDEEIVEEITTISSIIANVNIDHMGKINSNQYQWTVLCLKIHEIFKDVCTYDHCSDHLSIQFDYKNSGFKLFVDKTNDTNLWFPFVAPKIKYFGQKIPLKDYLLINNNSILAKSMWNLCNDIGSFIANVDTLMKNTDYYEFTDVDEAILQLVSTLGITYSFNDSTLPTYGGGYFEFDLWVPDDYPNSPPKMKFLTTGGGKIRFNPNLYNCGKVCLSLLNTWSTPQWSTSSSTISQVVISIYTMIFNEHPYTNEPAYYRALETETGRTASEKYNANIRKYTASVAISDQVKNKNSIFVDIIQKHWDTNKEKTIKVYEKHAISIAK